MLNLALRSIAFLFAKEILYLNHLFFFPLLLLIHTNIYQTLRECFFLLYIYIPHRITSRRHFFIFEFHAAGLLFDVDFLYDLILSKFSHLSNVLRIGQSGIPLCHSARNLGIMFESGLTMKQQVDRICQTAHFEIRRFRSIHQFLTTEATKILVTSLVLSRLDYRNFLLAGTPQTKFRV